MGEQKLEGQPKTVTSFDPTSFLMAPAKVFDVPVVLSTVETKSFSGNMWPQIQAVFPEQTPIERSSMNSWDDASGSVRQMNRTVAWLILEADHEIVDACISPQEK